MPIQPCLIFLVLPSMVPIYNFQCFYIVVSCKLFLLLFQSFSNEFFFFVFDMKLRAAVAVLIPSQKMLRDRKAAPSPGGEGGGRKVAVSRPVFPQVKINSFHYSVPSFWVFFEIIFEPLIKTYFYLWNTGLETATFLPPPAPPRIWGAVRSPSIFWLGIRTETAPQNSCQKRKKKVIGGMIFAARSAASTF